MARTKHTETKKRVATKGRAEEPNASSMSHSKCSQCCQLFKNFNGRRRGWWWGGKVHKLLEQLEVASDESDYEDEESESKMSKAGKITKTMIDTWTEALEGSPRRAPSTQQLRLSELPWTQQDQVRGRVFNSLFFFLNF